jgi:predicted O-methyltransferase YrrM
MLKRLIQKYIDELLDRDARNIPRELKRRSLIETCDFVEQNMIGVESFRDRYELLDHAIKNVQIENGLWLEFGIYLGNTINHIARQTNNTVYGFDSFEGLPEFWRDGYRVGDFKLDKLPEVEKNVDLIIGLFSDKIPHFLKQTKGVVSLVHIDCDLYSSSKTIFDLFKDRFVKGTIIVFDEFFNYPGWQYHEYKAFMEFIEENNKKFEFMGYVYVHSQVAVRILS